MHTTCIQHAYNMHTMAGSINTTEHSDCTHYICYVVLSNIMTICSNYMLSNNKPVFLSRTHYTDV